MLHHLQNLVQNMDFLSLGAAALRVAAVFLCLAVHETCHGLAALMLGDSTAKSMHRLSLNPFRHIDWFGLGMMLVAGFGWAKPVPVDPRYFKNPKRGMAITALAGPVSNLVLALLAMLLCKGIYLYAPYNTMWNAVFEFLLYLVAPLSIGLGLFNLVPIPPLDGAKVVGALLPDELYFKAMRYERFGMLALLAIVFFGIGEDFVAAAIQAVYTGMFNLFF